MSTALLRLLEREYLQRGHHPGVAGFKLLSSSEFQTHPPNTVSLFAYRVLVDAARRRVQLPLPLRSLPPTPTPHRQSVLHQPRTTALVVEVRYLLTAWFDDALTQHRVLSTCMAVLDAHSVLSPEHFDSPPPQNASIPVKVAFDDTSQEDVLRLFDSLSAPYHLSVPLRVRPVLLDPLVGEPVPLVGTAEARSTSELSP